MDRFGYSKESRGHIRITQELADDLTPDQISRLRIANGYPAEIEFVDWLLRSKCTPSDQQKEGE